MSRKSDSRNLNSKEIDNGDFTSPTPRNKNSEMNQQNIQTSNKTLSK